MWGYHAAKAWHLSHDTAHYRCVQVIMKDMGSKHVMDMFCYQHHAILVLVITATNGMMEATWHLTDAINGVQEAPPDEMAAIQNLHTHLLGKVPPQEPESPPQTCRAKEPLTVSPQAKPEHVDVPNLMWNPTAGKKHQTCPNCVPLLGYQCHQKRP
jgi:hypothetical protein